jgi:hypothetical protein
MAEKNNGNKKKKGMGDFVISGLTIIDIRSTSKIFELQSMSVDKAISELSKLNDLKLKQAGRDLRKQQSEQTKIIEQLMEKWG